MKHRLLRVAALLLPILTALPAVRAASTPLETTIRALLRKQRCTLQRTAVCVISATGREVVAVNGDVPLKPASNMKILTTAAALHFLGLDHEFETRIYARGSIRSNVLEGDLVVWGTGDPNISGRFFNDNPLVIFRKWATALRSSGLTEVRGDLVADDTYFDDVRFLPTWKRAEEGRWYSAQISPLSLNDNCLDIYIQPTTPGSRAVVNPVPMNDFVSVTGAPKTVSSGPTKIAIYRKTKTNKITIDGTINRRAKNWKDHVAIHDPALFFTHTLARVLKKEGIALHGHVRRVERKVAAGAADRTASAPIAARNGGTVLVRHTSTLRRDLPIINTRSQNLHAELLLKALGAAAAGNGSVTGGGHVIRRYLKAQGISATGLTICDGSGLSHGNRVTARMLGRVLDAARKTNDYAAYRDSLAVAGKSGTLKKRFREYPHLTGNVFAKTGYISGVSALSGYVRKGSTAWAFAILLNSFPRGYLTPKTLQERIVAEVYKVMP